MSGPCDALCVGAHPDDVEIGMGATVARMVAEGLRVVIVDLTDGEPTPFGSPEVRARESARAAGCLGVTTRRTLTQPNRYLFDTREAREELAAVIREFAPKTLFVPYPIDAHPDHPAASSIAMAARFYSKLTKTSIPGDPHYPLRVYRYMAVHLRLAVEPSFIVSVGSEALSAKMQALAAYESQFKANTANAGILERVELAARSWGALIGEEAGEPFFAIEPVGVRSFQDLV